MLVSMYILAYNHAHLISEAIEAALAQTYSPLEIIISDDCSTDGTWEIIQQRVRDYSGPHRLIARRNVSNAGIAEHVNQVWRACSGEWIIASAGDDTSLPNRVQAVVDVALSDPCVKLVQSWLNEVDEGGSTLWINQLDVAAHGQLAFTIEDRLWQLGYAAHGAAMAYSREVFDVFGPLPKTVIFEDNIVNVRAELLGELRVLPLPLVNHRNHAGQITRSDPGASAEIQRHRAELVVLSDLESTRQNAADLETVRERLASATLHAAREHFSRRIRFHHIKRLGLFKPWPIRVVYLARLLAHRTRLGPLRRDEIARALLPEPIYHWVKRR